MTGSAAVARSCWFYVPFARAFYAITRTERSLPAATRYLVPDGTALSTISRRKGLILDTRVNFLIFFRHYTRSRVISGADRYHTSEWSTIAFHVTTKCKRCYLNLILRLINLEILCLKFSSFLFSFMTMMLSDHRFDRHFAPDEGGLFFWRKSSAREP